MREQSTWWRAIFLALYLAFAILPLYWMLNMSFKTNTEIVSTLTLCRAISPSSTTARSSPIRPGIPATSTR